jgi:tRNA 2-thiouridine synthesizing protein A
MMKILTKSESENKTAFDQYLDAKGLNCPLPILKSKMLLNKMQADEVLLVEATDPHSKVDFEAYCARTEHTIIDSTLSEGVYSFTIKRAHNPKMI